MESRAVHETFLKLTPMLVELAFRLTRRVDLTILMNRQDEVLLLPSLQTLIIYADIVRGDKYALNSIANARCEMLANEVSDGGREALSLHNLRIPQHTNDNATGLRFLDQAERILKKWEPMLVQHLDDTHWAVVDGRTFLYVSTYDRERPVVFEVEV
ncbi:hypothetical protein B0H34DRAFT_795442 [Crassisporium funariophilum]|nr:hypothetical protein B0H34DRAFT_795442 [Crassisporium funariophilum]